MRRERSSSFPGVCAPKCSPRPIETQSATYLRQIRTTHHRWCPIKNKPFHATVFDGVSFFPFFLLKSLPGTRTRRTRSSPREFGTDAPRTPSGWRWTPGLSRWRRRIGNGRMCSNAGDRKRDQRRGGRRKTRRRGSSLFRTTRTTRGRMHSSTLSRRTHHNWRRSLRR